MTQEPDRHGSAMVIAYALVGGLSFVAGVVMGAWVW